MALSLWPERWATDGNFHGSHGSQENAVGMGINDLFTWEWEWYFVNGREYRDCSRKFLAAFVGVASCIAWKGNYILTKLEWEWALLDGNGSINCILVDLYWRRGVVVSGVRQWTKLTHVGPGYNWDGWPSSGGYTISVCNQPTRSTQPCIPPGSLNRVPASAGVKAGMSPVPGGR